MGERRGEASEHEVSSIGRLEGDEEDVSIGPASIGPLEGDEEELDASDIMARIAAQNEEMELEGAAKGPSAAADVPGE